MKQKRTKWLVRLFLMFVAVSIFTLSLSSPVFAQLLLKQGMRGQEVINLQNRLKSQGYYTGLSDGVFGDQTYSAVLNFQCDNDLESDGVVGQETMNCLMSTRPNDAVSRGQKISRRGQQIVTSAKSYLGVPYVWGGKSPNGFDCSGFIYYIFSQYGHSMPRMADGQFEVGQHVKRGDLQPGDLVFFTTYEPGASHVGIYIGDNRFIHASSAAEEVTITPLNKTYYVERYLGARRL